MEKQVGMVLHSFARIEQAVAELIEPATLARYRANAAALHNRAVFEIPDILERIFERSQSGRTHRSRRSGRLPAGVGAPRTAYNGPKRP